MNQKTVLLLLVSLCIGCSSGARTQDQVSKLSCVDMQGIWVEARYGDANSGYCLTRTADAGQLCQFNKECQTACITNDNVKSGDAASGQCFEWSILVGHCVNVVNDNGLATGTICYD